MKKAVPIQEILVAKRREIRQRKRELPASSLREMLERVPPPRGFIAAIEQTPLALIAEVKRASPSSGKMRECDPPSLAALLDRSPATCLSILTDSYFEGDLSHLKIARGLVRKPILRKDFILDPYQLLEARVFGADAILLIASCLSRAALGKLFERAHAIDLDVLVEVHAPEEIEKIPDKARLVGINNRQLFSGHYTTDLAVTETILPLLPKGRLVIAESGVATRQDVERLRSLGVNGILVGTALMKAEDPVQKIKELLSEKI